MPINLNKETVSVKVASFMEAFKKFLSYSDGSLDINTLTSFSELKQVGRITYSNQEERWCGNHHSSNSYVELFHVEQPTTFYIVKYHYNENSDNSHSRTETSVFVP